MFHFSHTVAVHVRGRRLALGRTMEIESTAVPSASAIFTSAFKPSPRAQGCMLCSGASSAETPAASHTLNSISSTRLVGVTWALVKRQGVDLPPRSYGA
jgi:hypothetical protein